MNRCKEIEKATLAASVIIGVSGAGLLGACAQTWNLGEMQPTLRSTIAFVSTPHDPAADPAVNTQRALLATEIYLMNGDGANPRRLTENAYADGFPALSPEGNRIVFESNRLRSEGEPFNRSDLFVMNTDGTERRADERPEEIREHIRHPAIARAGRAFLDFNEHAQSQRRKETPCQRSPVGSVELQLRQQKKDCEQYHVQHFRQR